MTQTEQELTEMVVKQNDPMTDVERHAFNRRFSDLWGLAVADAMIDGIGYDQANARLHNMCDAAVAKAAS